MILSLKSLAQSQCETQNPCFTADNTRVCVGALVNFNKCDGWTNVTFDFGDGQGKLEDSTITSYVYNQPGQYKVYQHGNDKCHVGTFSGPLIIDVLPQLPPKFEVKSCAGKGVEVTITDTDYDQYSINWDAENPSSTMEPPVPKGASPQTHIYPALSYTKEYSIKVEGNLPYNCKNDSTQTVTVFPSIEKPSIASLKSDKENQITIEVGQLLPYLNYEIAIEKNGLVIENIELSKENGNYNTSYTITSENISNSTSVYCVKLIAKDLCGQESYDQVCTIHLNAEAVFDQNTINWEVDQNEIFNDFSLIKNQNKVADFTASSRSYSDSDVQCNKNYCYQMTGTKNGIMIYSNVVCVVGRSNKTPATIENLTASVEDGKIIISWGKPSTAKEFKLAKSSDTNPQIVYSGSDALFADQSDLSTSNCYNVSYVDSCGNNSLNSQQACSMVLSVNLIAKDDHQLQWTDYKGWKDGVEEYFLQVLDLQGEVIKEKPLGIVTSYKDKDHNELQLVRYRIKAKAAGLDLVSFSNIVEIKENFVIVLPNVFSPNNDNLNDRFTAVGNYIKDIKIQIFNKWGELIYEGQDWDGVGKHGRASEGIYIYYLEAEDESGQKITKRGTVTLIR